MQFILIGAGQRGMIYANYAHAQGHAITAVADIDAEKRQAAARAFGIPEGRCYDSAEALLAEERLADAAIIATMDRDHHRHAMPALEKGYHLLLEKPISPVPEEVLAIEAAAIRHHRQVAICHVLRYAPFFRELKRLLDSGVIGRVLTIQHSENIGNYHFAHSFVRGNWRRQDQASPLLMQKSCHDMDLLVWLVGSDCRQIASFGELTYFTAAHAPEGAAHRCADCPLKDTCRFSAYKSYLPARGSWPASVLTEDQSTEGLKEAIAKGAYGRCVYHCDNDVCDHQVTILQFDNGVTATFNLSAFTDRIARTLKIMGEDGEIRASELTNAIEVIPFAANGVERRQSMVIHPQAAVSGHGGGDSQLMDDFIDLLSGKRNDTSSSITQSTQSHMMACAAEEARLHGSVVDVAAYRRRHTRE
ncbi:MAG: Gfo/Idh/MocA family oxidoreductase [Oscillospiraceae bacterium]|jgi:predicted dehydrogenase|nr:Gfo/Idh/MocA family oxidoreductase [Oscillospiraceae bacterium]